MGYKTYKVKRFGAFIIGVLAFILLFFLSILFFQKSKLVGQLQKSYEEKTKELSHLKEEKERFVYVTNRDIKAGEHILSSDVTYEKGYSSMEESLFATIEEENPTALVNLPKGTQILNSMLTKEEIDSHIREEEFNVFYLSENLNTLDVVDIRIFYPNGENYIVLSKKMVKEIYPEKAKCFLWLDEQETLLISSAIVDAYFMPGTYLYTTKYVESTIQEPSIVTYTPKKETIDLIQNSPNILEVAKRVLSKKVRENLEIRTKEYLKTEGEAKAIEKFPDFIKHSNLQQEEDEEESIEETKGEEEIIYVD